MLIVFGAAAITLNRCREEANVPLPQVVTTEIDQFVVAAYQIRNAFAHDIAEPVWRIDRPHHRRDFNFGDIRVDLSRVHGKHFEWNDIGGIETLSRMRRYAVANVFR